MDLNLWFKLKAYSDRNWLYSISSVTENKLMLDRQYNDCGKLWQLTQEKTQQIATFKPHPKHKLEIIVAESEPVEFLAAFLAGVINEANIFLANPHWQQQEWQEIFSLIKPDLWFTSPSVQNLISNLTPIQSRVINNNLSEQSWIAIPTGGSSGKIKFALHSWSSLQASVEGFQQYFACPQVNSFCTLPLYHVSGLMQFMRSFISQGDLIICPYKLLKTQKINCDRQDWFISLVPTQLQLLIELMPDWLAEFKTILLGGAPPSQELLEQARKYQLPLAPTYGMTETASQVATLKPQDFLAGNNSSGRVLPHAEIKIQPQTGQNSASKVGLLQIKSTSLYFGYYPQTLKQKKPPEQSLLTTDDLGYFDDAGYLHIVGRNSHKIITGGENVFPREVETAILATKLVADVCVIGIRDRYWGEVVTAVYVPDQKELSSQTISAQIKLSLAKYKQPKYWIQVERIERNDRGKIDYGKIKAIAEQRIVVRQVGNDG